MTSRFRTGHATAAEWTAQDPVLLAGELGIETDTGYAKIGDGSTRWVSLPYFPVGAPTEVHLAASDSGSGVTSMAAQQNGLSTSDIGVLVPVDGELSEVLVSWCSDNIPAGDWTATLDRKAAGEDSWSVVATFDFETS